MDETYIKVNGQWTYLYRAVDKDGQTIDFLVSAHRDKKAAKGPVKIPGFCFTPACDGGPERRGVQDGMRFPI